MMREKIDQLAGYVFHIFEWAVRILLVVIILLITLQVLLRAVINKGLIWAEEVALIGFIYITFFTMAIAMRYDLHLRVQLFVSGLPRPVRRAIEFLDNVFLLILSVLMLYTGIQLTMHGTGSIMPATQWPTSVIYAPTAITGVVCTLHQILRLTGITHSDVANEYIEGVFKE